jgi:hypothetical protein
MMTAPSKSGPTTIAKATANDFPGRFREVIADPLNLLIPRVPQAGTVRDGLVCLHNGLLVPCEGDAAYYGHFSELLIFNRGVHEPLEEFVFQTMLPTLPAAPRMLELGAYWGHYSMWLQHCRPDAELHLVEPDAKHLAVGQLNLARNGMSGKFTQAFVGRAGFLVDEYLHSNGIGSLDVLHADIQGNELEMLEGAHGVLQRGGVARVFISTHTQDLHLQVIDQLAALGYRIEVSADYSAETTSYDGLVFASHPSIAPLFVDLKPMSRERILGAGPTELYAYVKGLIG